MPLLKTPSAVETEGGVMEIRPGCDGHYKLRDQIAMLPSPRAGNPGSRPNQKGGKILAVDNFHGHRTEEFQNGRTPTPSEAIGTSRGLKLQPAFVEWMMGYPLGFTHVESPASKHSATPSFLRSPSRSSKQSPTSKGE